MCVCRGARGNRIGRCAAPTAGKHIIHLARWPVQRPTGGVLEEAGGLGLWRRPNLTGLWLPTPSAEQSSSRWFTRISPNAGISARFVGHLAKCFPDRIPDFANLERLVQTAKHPKSHGVCRQRPAVVACHPGHPSSRAQGSDNLCKLNTVCVWHPQISNDQIESGFLDPAQCAAAILSGHHLISVATPGTLRMPIWIVNRPPQRVVVPGVGASNRGTGMWNAPLSAPFESQPWLC